MDQPQPLEISQIDLEKLKAEIREQVDQRVLEHTGRAKAWLEFATGWATKILGIGGALLLFSLALLGFRNASDISSRLDEISKTTSEKAQKQLSESLDQQKKIMAEALSQQNKDINEKIEIAKNSAFERLGQSVQTRLDESFINALLDKMSRGSATDRLFRSQLDIWEKDRLLTILHQKDTKPDLLVKTLQVLMQSRDIPRDKVDADIDMHISNCHKDGKILKSEIPRITELLKWLNDQNRPTLSEVVRPILSIPEAPSEVKLLAAEFLGRNRDTLSVPMIEKLIDSADDESKGKFIIALFRITSESPKVREAIESKLNSPLTDLYEAHEVSEFAMAVISSPSRIDPFRRRNSTDRHQRVDLVEKLITKLANSGIKTYYDTVDLNEDSRGQLMISNEKNEGSYITIDENLFIDNNSFNNLIKRSLENNEDSLWKGLLGLACAKDSRGFSNNDFEYVTAIEIEMSDDSSFTTSNGQTVKISDMILNPIILPSSSNGNPIIRWRDKLGRINDSEFKGLNNCSSCEFSVKALTKIEWGEEE